MLMILDGGSGYCSPCNTVFKTVDKLPTLDMANRNHAYILPDNSVWILNHDGTEFITNPHSTIDLSSKQDRLTAGEGISIKDNVISATPSELSQYKAGDGIKIEDNIISADQPKIEHYVLSGGTTSPVSPQIVLTVEYIKLPAYETYEDGEGNVLAVVFDKKITFDVIVNRYNSAANVYKININENIYSLLHDVMVFHDKLRVGPISLKLDKTLNVVDESYDYSLSVIGLTNDVEHSAYSASYYIDSSMI